jgi:hypothetical protein
MPQLTEWLKLMVSEINRKREDESRAHDEELKRQTEQTPTPAPSRTPSA